MNEEQNALDQLGQTLLDVNTDAAIDLAELAVDGLINDEVIKDIPIIRGVYGSLKSVKAIAEYYSRIKLYKFVMSAQSTDYDEKKWSSFRDKMNSNKSFFQKMLAEIIVFSDKQLDDKKNAVLGRIFAAFVNNKISYPDFQKMMGTLNVFLLSDEPTLESVYNSPQKESNANVSSSLQRLFLLGLVNHYSPFERTHEGRLPGHPDKGFAFYYREYDYVISEYGKQFYQYGFTTTRENTI